MKKVFCFGLAIILIFSMSIVAFAAENGGDFTARTEDLSHNYNVTTICPWEQVSTYGVNPPSEAWHIFDDGVYYFAGTASYSTLYLSKLIWGSNYYIMDVENRSYSNQLSVIPHDVIPTATITVAPRDSAYQKFMLKEGKTYFCLSFPAPSDFEGSICGDYYQ